MALVVNLDVMLAKRKMKSKDLADAIGISRGAVKSHASRGMASLRLSLEQTE